MKSPSIYSILPGMGLACLTMIAFSAVQGAALQETSTTATVVNVGSPLSAKLQMDLSGHLPTQIEPPGNLTHEEARPWFDVFSWQSFIAMNWPAYEQDRGKPYSPDDLNVLRNPPTGAMPVFSTYREAFELFNQGDKVPVAWNSSTVGVIPCQSVVGSAASGNEKALVMAAKTGTVLDEINEAFSFPIIDQNKAYAWSEVRFNQAQYDFIRDNQYYLAQKLAANQPINMPASDPDQGTIGAVMVKATWKVMSDKDDSSRYITTPALRLTNPKKGECTLTEMGLVGFHVAQKTTQFPEWVWSTFEQIDNIEPPHGISASFNNGTDYPPTPNGWANRPPKVPPLLPEDKRTPTQITRYNPIPTTPAWASTVVINQTYQNSAALKGTPYAYYQLVITQWPTDPGSFRVKGSGCASLEGCAIYPRDSGQPFPVNGAVNPVMETYFQSPGDAFGSGGNSCMSCHYGAGKSDYSWVLQNRAH